MDPIPDASDRRRKRVRKSGGILRGVENSSGAPKLNSEELAKKRQMLANFCRLLEEQVTGRPSAGRTPLAEIPRHDPRLDGLSPRVRQTLGRMLAGDSEKEVARNLGVSRHTVHIYVKTLYRHFDVNSRGELLARFVEGAFRQPESKSTTSNSPTSNSPTLD